MNDEHAQQMVRALIGIGSELTAIRQELQQLNGDADRSGDALETFVCQSCGDSIAGEEHARRHARDEHNAPSGAWETLYQ